MIQEIEKDLTWKERNEEGKKKQKKESLEMKKKKKEWKLLHLLLLHVVESSFFRCASYSCPHTLFIFISIL